ncbi:MAG: peptide chain release factor N(5)-glutamine methyltransferase [Pseudomonadota bacterium]
MQADFSISAVLSRARARLAKCSESPRLDAEMLLALALDVPRSYLLAHPEDELDEVTLARFERSIERRLERVPIAYLTGLKEFWTLSLTVTPATLVPRPETELLVEVALRELPADSPSHVADLGTGSGAIALAIAKERPRCLVWATDASEAALAVAAENARQNDVANVEFLHGDWLAPLGDRRVDLLISNPPYVRSDDPVLAALRHEPKDALASGADGLDAIRTIANAAVDHVTPEGLLLLEHGADQRADVVGILHDSGWLDVSCHDDLSGRPRAVCARRASAAS